MALLQDNLRFTVKIPSGHIVHFEETFKLCYQVIQSAFTNMESICKKTATNLQAASIGRKTIRKLINFMINFELIFILTQ